MQPIINIVANSLLLKPGDLKGKSRRSDIVFARYLAMYIILQGNSCTFTEVGRVFNRYPAVASRAYQRIAKLVTTDPLLGEYILEVGRRV